MGADPARGATPAELDAYRKRGFFVRPALFAPGELAELRDAVEAVHARIAAAAGTPDAAAVEYIDGKRYQRLLESTVKWEWDDARMQVRSMEPFLHLDPRLADLPDDPRLAACAADIVGAARLALFTDKLNFKRPDGAPFPWHQDTPYWAFGCDHVDRLASVQLYLDDAHRDNGCLWAISGSHRQGALPTYQDRGTLGRLYTNLDHVDADDAVPLEAPAGSAIFFDGHVVHGSRSNRAGASRRAIILTYQPGGHPRWNRDDVREIALR